MPDKGSYPVANPTFSVLLCFILTIMLFSEILGEKTQIIETQAQIVPLPPATQQPIGQAAKINSSAVITNGSRVASPPVVEFLTNSLIEGKNVVKLKITDKSALLYAELRYVQNGQIVTTGLAKDPNDVYKALIDVHAPSALLVANAVDVNGKKVSAVKDFDVHSLSDTVFNQISRFFYDSGKMLLSIFTSPHG